MNNTISRPLPRMRSIKAAAKELSIPEYALRRWIKSGAVPAVNTGKKFLVNLDKLIDFLEGGEQT